MARLTNAYSLLNIVSSSKRLLMGNISYIPCFPSHKPRSSEYTPILKFCKVVPRSTSRSLLQVFLYLNIVYSNLSEEISILNL